MASLSKHPQTEKMVEAAGEYFAPFLKGENDDFTSLLEQYCDSDETEDYMRQLVAAGLLQMGFEMVAFAVPDFEVRAPSSPPAEIIPMTILDRNFGRLDLTILDLGTMATSKASPEYSQDIVDFVEEEIAYG